LDQARARHRQPDGHLRWVASARFRWRRNGPPEDVGGIFGYADFLEAWRNPLHEDHHDMRKWVGRKFDPEDFDLDHNNKAIARAIRRSKGSYRFRHGN
jgi:hypothetical protein